MGRPGESATLKIDIWTPQGNCLPVDDGELCEALAPHLERVSRLCSNGFQAGEIVDDRFRGWWAICRNEVTK